MKSSEEIRRYYKLNEIEALLDRFEIDLSDKIEELEIKHSGTIIEYYLYAFGKSDVSMREIIVLCESGFPDGALSIARNVYEQLIISLFIEDKVKKNEKDVLTNYFKEHSNNHGESVLYNKYRWTGIKNPSFFEVYKDVKEERREIINLLTMLHELYYGACKTIHASYHGNAVRLGNNFSGIDIGPWDTGQEYSLFLSVTSFVHIVSATYTYLQLDIKEINKELNDLSLYYMQLIKENDPKEGNIGRARES